LIQRKISRPAVILLPVQKTIPAGRWVPALCPMNKKTYHHCAQLLLTLTLAAAATAAPVAPTDAGDVPDQSATAAIGRATQKTGATETAGGARAVDLLIELQSKTAGLDFDERARENGTATRPGASLATGNTVVTGGVGATPAAGGLFGSGAVPMPPPKETSSRDSDWRTPARSASPSYQADARSEGDAGGGRVSLPREIVQWVRDNRAMVVGVALLVLAALWGTSLAVSRRR